MAAPALDITVDPATAESLKEGVLRVLARVRPDWEEDQIQLKTFTDGLTNKLMGGWRSGHREDTVLVRVYGNSTERYIDRGAEVANMRLLETAGDGAKLYGCFTNGLAYEFVAGEVIEPGQQPPAVYREVSRALARMHGCGPVAGKEAGPAVWRFLASLAALYPGGGGLLGLLTGDQLLQEISLLKESLGSDLRLVFAHNDAMPANMVLTQQGTVRFIDLEYSGPNPAALDIAGVFNEWVGFDLANMDFEGNYPAEETVRDWLTHYLREQHNGREPSEAAVSALREEVRRFSPLTHLVWSTWAVIQAHSSSIDYDYLEYARQRLAQYRRLRAQAGLGR